MLKTLTGNDGKKIFIHRNIEINCTDDDADTSCGDKHVWVSEDDDFDLEELHQQHVDGGPHKVIVIKKKIAIED